MKRAEEEYVYEVEVKKWLKPKPKPAIRVGAEFQAVIPPFCPSATQQKPSENPARDQRLAQPAPFEDTKASKESKKSQETDISVSIKRIHNYVTANIGTTAEPSTTPCKSVDMTEQKKPKVEPPS